MYVCICRGVTDEHIKTEVSEGACTLKEVSRRLGVATQCGKCGKCARAVVREALESSAGQIGVLADADFLPAPAA